MEEEILKEENVSDFGQRLRAIRKSLQLKQRDFANDLDVSVTTLSDIETGKSKPGLDFFVRLSGTFNVNLYYLFFGEGEMFRKKDDTGPMENFLGESSEDVKEFLTYFFNSKLVQYQVLGYFRRFLNEEEEAINKDLEKNKKKPT
jgi:transcriptional regulator with XRE-family HTH domain